MEIRKEAAVGMAGAPTPEQLERINRLARSPMGAEQVYVFSLRLCDDQPDRDLECFDTEALPRLAELFVGKTGVLDHNWSARAQVARIFDAQVQREGEASFIKAWAYLRRDKENEGLIGDIEAGIKKEVSVGCAMAGAKCSICGQDAGTCGHEKGQLYDGKLCLTVLTDPTDAYEFSFVAVPAQREAGVLKGVRASRLCLEDLVRKQAGVGAAEEYRTLKAQAELGRRYEKEQREQVVRLGLALELGIGEAYLRRAVERMGQEELEVWKKALGERAAALYPPEMQLPGAKQAPGEPDSGFLI